MEIQGYSSKGKTNISRKSGTFPGNSGAFPKKFKKLLQEVQRTPSGSLGNFFKNFRELLQELLMKSTKRIMENFRGNFKKISLKLNDLALEVSRTSGNFHRTSRINESNVNASNFYKKF